VPTLPITNPTCIVRNTGAARGRTLAVAPGQAAVKHLRYGGIILPGGEAPIEIDTGGFETGLITLSGEATVTLDGFLWTMAAEREHDDRLFGVVNVHPDFASGGSGIERGRAR
jgi:hypothetical protein